MKDIKVQILIAIFAMNLSIKQIDVLIYFFNQTSKEYFSKKEKELINKEQLLKEKNFIIMQKQESKM